jgi:hypothetical protein
MFKRIICVFGVLFFLISCGDGESTDGDNNEEPDQVEYYDDDVTDDEIVDDLEVEDVEIIPEYPEVTTSSKKKGDIAQNLKFIDHNENERSLSEFYKNKKLVWLIFSTYDCPACNVEKYDIPELNKADYRERGFEVILIMNGLLSGPQPNLEPDKVAKLREAMMMGFGKEGDHVYGYLTHGHQMTFQKFINAGYPVNILIDGNTMEIIDHWEGWDPNGVSKIDKFIDFMLDEL